MSLLAVALARDPGADIATGFKISRSDPLHRVIIVLLYHHFVIFALRLPLRDTDCDFRLMRRAVFDRVRLESDSGTIALEMVKKFHDAGFRFVEVPVHHYHRAYGGSQFFNFRRLFRTAVQLSQLWWKLVIRRERLVASSLFDDLHRRPRRDHRRRGRTRGVSRSALLHARDGSEREE